MQPEQYHFIADEWNGSFMSSTCMHWEWMSDYRADNEVWLKEESIQTELGETKHSGSRTSEDQNQHPLPPPPPTQTKHSTNWDNLAAVKQ